MLSDLTLVLIAAPGSGHLNETVLTKALGAIRTRDGGRGGACMRWLSPGEA